MSPDDLHELSSVLAAKTLITARVPRSWADRTRLTATATADALESDPVRRLRRELEALPPAGTGLSWIEDSVSGRDKLRVSLSGGTLVLVRPRREENHQARFRTVAWVPDRAHGTANTER